MQFKLTDAITVLANTPATLRTVLADHDDIWATTNYGTDTFSPFDVLGHLIHGDRCDWITRLNIILDHGTTRPFDKFDRYAMYEESKGKTTAMLLDEFDDVRTNALAQLRQRNLTDDDLNKQGSHPALGIVTARQLIAAWVVHDLNHIHQITKCMAWQYRDAMGPWRQYLTFIDR